MEVELKYSIPNGVVADDILGDRYLKSIEESDSRETVEMRAKYFDTEEHDLMKNDMAFRIREEGDRMMATLKWNGTSEGALHQRQELNVQVSEKTQMDKPNIVVFEESEIGEELIDLVGGKKLICLLETNFTRRRFRVEADDAIMEISVDEGAIEADGRSEPICEVEIELFTGDEESLIKLGKRIRNQFGLEQEERSKYRRGLDLLKDSGQK